MAGCKISQNMCKVLDVIDYADYEQLETLIIFLDFEKAFDWVEKCAIIGTSKYLTLERILLNGSSYFIPIFNRTPLMQVM